MDGSFSPFTIQVNLSVSYPGLLSALTISGSNLPTAVVGKAYTPNDAGFSVTAPAPTSGPSSAVLYRRRSV